MVNVQPSPDKGAKPAGLQLAAAGAGPHDELHSRSEARSPNYERFDVFVGNLPGWAPLPATGIDVSERGMCFAVASPIEPGVNVCVRPVQALPEQDGVAGRVVYCTQTVGGYKVGLHID
jgi:hypothetical protein